MHNLTMDDLYRTAVTVLLSATAFFLVKLITQLQDVSDKYNEQNKQLAVLNERVATLIDVCGVNTDDIKVLGAKMHKITNAVMELRGLAQLKGLVSDDWDEFPKNHRPR